MAVVLGEELTAAASSALLQRRAAWAMALCETAFPVFPSGSYWCDRPIGAMDKCREITASVGSQAQDRRAKQGAEPPLGWRGSGDLAEV